MKIILSKYKQTIITSLLILIIFGLISIVVFGSKQKDTSQVATNDSGVVENIDILYWGITCPHCHDTIEWIEENKIEEKIKIIRKEIYENEDNSKELVKKATACGYGEDEIGVPLMYTKTQECLIGTPEISNYLQEEVNKLEGNNE